MCRIGADGKLYISLGQPFNVPPREKPKLHDDVGIGGIIRLNAFNGSGREVFAHGVRSSVGIEFNPDNQTDDEASMATCVQPCAAGQSPTIDLARCFLPP